MNLFFKWNFFGNVFIFLFKHSSEKIILRLVSSHICCSFSLLLSNCFYLYILTNISRYCVCKNWSIVKTKYCCFRPIHVNTSKKSVEYAKPMPLIGSFIHCWIHIRRNQLVEVIFLEETEFESTRKLNSPLKMTIELFIVEYKCFTCEHQWLFTSAEVVTLETCRSCGGYARVLNVVSSFTLVCFDYCALNVWKFIYFQWRRLTSSN